MKIHNIETKYDVDDIVIGFPHRLPMLLKIDRVDVNFERFDKDNPEFTRYKVRYLATPVNDKYTGQSSYNEDELFTKETLKKFIDDFINKIK